jgi:hypothetical protein
VQVINKIRKSRKRDYLGALSWFFVSATHADLSNFDVVVYTKTGFQKETGAMAATCMNLDEDTIEVVFDSRLSGKELLIAAAHEFVHVRQLAFGELCYRGETPYWNGKRAGHYAYEDKPWEIEAFSEMIPLIERVIQIGSVASLHQHIN